MFSTTSIPTNIRIIITLFTLILHTTTLDALKCVCNVNDCDLVKAEDCPGRGVLVWDPCRCCKICARTHGEICGGPGGFSGTCEPPLKCISKPPIIGTGICLELPQQPSNLSLTSQTQTTRDVSTQKPSNSTCEKLEIHPGCEIVDRRCQCWQKSITVCRESSVTKWDFKNSEECELNLEDLLKQEVEFDEDFTIPPNSYEFAKKSKKQLIKRKKAHDLMKKQKRKLKMSN